MVLVTRSSSGIRSQVVSRMRHDLILGEEAEGGLLNGQRLAAEKNRSHMVLVTRSSKWSPTASGL